MNTHDEDFLLIEDFLKDNLDVNTKEAVLKRLSLDDVFYQDFQLWTNLDSWLKELPAFEISEALSERMEVRETVYLYKKPSFIFAMACSILILLGVGLYLVEKNRTTHQLLGEVRYAEINASQSGHGMAGGDDSKPNFSNQPFEAAEYDQKDTTYQFSFEPFMLKFRMPKVYKNFGKNLNIIYDYKLDKYRMTLENRIFNIEEGKEWKKLYPSKTIE